LPPYEHNLLGGAQNLRGYDVGYKANDNLAAASVEVRVPITSPLSIGRFGVKAFVDYGAAYAHGSKLADQDFDRGIGGGVYLHLTLLNASLDVARSSSGDTRFHFGMGVTFK
jgi:hemolysin activation/secretion protein